jgi:Arc/MetJ-type ribon-helix-helix transcriptional regulator
MSEEPEITVEEKNQAGEIEVKHAEEKKGQRPSDPLGDIASSVKEFATKIPDSISKAVERALSGRDFPLMVRINDESLKRIDALVEAGIFKSRSESAAFLISEGIKTQNALFERIESKIKEIEQLRSELKNIIHSEIS